MAFKPVFTRTFNNKGGHFAKGKNAVGICHRSGFKVPYKELVFEPGTNYLVHKSETDGNYSLVNHPQNFPPSPDKLVDRISLKWSFPDVPLSLGTVVSADQLGLPSHASTFYSSTVWPSIGTGISAPPVSIGAGVSDGRRTDFSVAANSMYYVVIFQGI